MYMQAPHSYCACDSHDVHQQLSRWVTLMYFPDLLVMPDSSKQSATPLLVLFRFFLERAASASKALMV